MVERKGATATITKTVPRQRSGSGNSIEVPVKKNKCVEHARVTGSDPGYRVSHMTVARKRETLRTRCRQRVHLIQHKQSFSNGRHGVIPSKGAFTEWFEFVKGSSGSRSSGEVLDDSKPFGVDGSGTW